MVDDGSQAGHKHTPEQYLGFATALLNSASGYEPTHVERLLDKGTAELGRQPAVETLYNFAEAYESAGFLAAALRLYQRLLHQRPGHGLAQVRLGRLYLDFGRSDLALRLFEEAARGGADIAGLADDIDTARSLIEAQNELPQAELERERAQSPVPTSSASLSEVSSVTDHDSSDDLPIPRPTNNDRATSPNRENPDADLETTLLAFKDEHLETMLRLFGGREGVYARQWVNDRGEVGYVPVRAPLTTLVLADHLRGRITVGVYPLAMRNEVRFVAFDIDFDISVEGEPYAISEMRRYSRRALDYARVLCQAAQRLGLNLYPEDSGSKGYHCWCFFEMPLDAGKARRLAANILTLAGEPPSGISVEVFPKQSALGAKQLGNLIKLPLGRHLKTGRRCLWLERDSLEPSPDQLRYLLDITVTTPAEISAAFEPLPPDAVANPPWRNIEADASGSTASGRHNTNTQSRTTAKTTSTPARPANHVTPMGRNDFLLDANVTKLLVKAYQPADVARPQESLFAKICDLSTLWEAWTVVRRNHGGPGNDSVTVEEFGLLIKDNLMRLQRELADGGYLPYTLRRVDIPKPSGGERSLHIPAVRDRVVETAIKDTLEPMFDPGFRWHSFGFRPRRAVWQAIDQVQRYIAEGARWVLEADIEKCFDTLDRQLLLSFLLERIHENDVLDLIELVLDADVAGAHQGSTMGLRGAAQGSPLSPLLTNIYLDYYDREAAQAGFIDIRYADDFVVLCRSKREAEAALDKTLEAFDFLKLRLNSEKTGIRHVDTGFTFLGFQFSGEWVRICPKDEAQRQKVVNLRHE